MIRFKKVTKQFGERKVLEDVNFEIESKELVFLTGPSGSGKTTLIRLILKEFEPTAGDIFVDRWDLAQLGNSQLPALRRKVGVVFQDFKLLLDRTVRENVALALEVLGDDDKKIGPKVDEVLKMVGLKDKDDYFPSQLAGGEIQRVCIARSIVAQPDVLIADEPTGNLDLTTTWQIINLLKDIHRMGKTVVIATHNFEIVNSLGERVLELEQGKLVRDEKKGRYRVT